MKLLRSIRDSDVGLDTPAPENYIERTASRAIVFDTHMNIALLHATKKGYHKLPGGGVEKDEDLHMALRRELLEEIGCEAENFRKLGVIEEHRKATRLHHFSHCFIANLKEEKGVPHLEPDEKADGFETEWMSLRDAIVTLESETTIQNYEGKFIRLRDLTFLKEAAGSQLITPLSR